MEFLEGGDLSSVHAQRGALPVEEAVDFVLQAGEAISAAHALGIVHRDLKPANLFCIRRGDGTLCIKVPSPQRRCKVHRQQIAAVRRCQSMVQRWPRANAAASASLGRRNPIIKVLDFGISKVAGSPQDHGMTKTTAMMGSPYYMSPEQMESTRSVDGRTDIWALGVVLHELLTGKTPFQGSTLPEVCVRIATQPPPTLRSLRPNAPAALEPIIQRCLEKDRDRRFANVSELAVALMPFASVRGKQSAETIVRTLQQAGHGPPSAWRNGNEHWARDGNDGAVRANCRRHRSQEQGSGRSRRRAGDCCRLGGRGGTFAVRARNQSTAASASPATAAPGPVASAAPSVAPSATLEPLVAPATTTSAATATSSPASSTALPALHPAAIPGTRKPVGGAPGSAAKPRPNCDPNFTLDANGEKHFKPDCF